VRDVILQGDALEMLKTLPDESIDCCVTSPPYWSLRDYGVDGQIGLEETLQEWIDKLVAVFREVRRVLKDEGTLWLNLGDAYAGGGRAGKDGIQIWGGIESQNQLRKYGPPSEIPDGLKPKDLIGQPWRLAFALQADGWWLRSDIIWAKLNPMPESVTDRPTKSHEYLFLLSKRARYFYDAEAIKEKLILPKAANGTRVFGGKNKQGANISHARTTGRIYNTVPSGRNRRTVWNIATQPMPDAHFATFPEALVEPCIRAGTSQEGYCECGKPWVRVVERKQFGKAESATKYDNTMKGGPLSHSRQAYRQYGLEGPPSAKTIGWQPSCSCDNPTKIAGIVLDPFIGSGTVGLVAKKLNRCFIGIELNPSYIEIAEKRLSQMGLFIGK
jgi:DNA modification methylase